MTGVYLAPLGTPAPIHLEYDHLVRQLRAARAPWHLTFDTPSTPTRQDPIVPDLAPCRFGIPGCLCSTPSAPAPTPEAPRVTAITEYGVRRAHPVTGAERIQWPTPGTGLIALPGGTVDGTDLDGIWEALKAHPSLEGASVVVRSYDVEEVPKPAPALPTTPGSVVRATTTYDGTILLMRSDHSPGEWLGWNTGLSEPDSWSGAGFTDVEILFDAGTAP